MADTITGKVWALDTVAGLVSSLPVGIHSIRVRFTTAGAGSCQLSTVNSADLIVNCITTAASTAVVFDPIVSFTMGNQIYNGLQKVLMVNVGTIEVVTCVPH